jgi:hypothetical protein
MRKLLISCVNLTFSGEDSVSIQGVSAQAGLSREVYDYSSSSFLLDFLLITRTRMFLEDFCYLPENGDFFTKFY